MATLLKNLRLVLPDPPHAAAADLRIEGGLIAARGTRLRPLVNDRVVDCGGAVAMPGMVCAHTHLYSSLSRGMPLSAPRNFLAILDRIWWRLDRALDEETILLSALAGAIEAAKCGTTTLVDHHASPSCIAGSLDLVAAAMRTVGLRGLLCYETTDRGGRRGRDAGLRENARFLDASARDPLLRGTVGAHASFTLGDGSLARLGEMAAAYRTGVHIHLAEDAADVRDAARRGRRNLVGRLAAHGLLNRRSILAHAVHCTPAELARVRRSGAWLVHNPRSNMNNAVGAAPLGHFGPRAAIGTDGFPADMFEEAKIGYLRNREARSAEPFGRYPGLLGGGQRLASEFFGMPFGTLAPGSAADLILLDYDPPTPLNGKTLHAHLLFGMHARMVTDVMVNGRWVVRRRCLAGIDEEAVMAAARKAAARLWRKASAL